MSDTPRTDAYLIESDPTRKHIVGAAFARDLERELAAAKADADRYRIMWERDSTALGKVLADLRTAKAVMEDQRAEVERLREALNTMLDYYGEDEHNKATHDAARAALAKEQS
jgi:hypothetical protein